MAWSPTAADAELRTVADGFELTTGTELRRSVHAKRCHAEREEIRRAARESLSGFFRTAGLERAAQDAVADRFETRRQVAGFFAQAKEEDGGTEPEWTEHLRAIDRSRSAGGHDG